MFGWPYFCCNIVNNEMNINPRVQLPFVSLSLLCRQSVSAVRNHQVSSQKEEWWWCQKVSELSDVVTSCTTGGRNRRGSATPRQGGWTTLSLTPVNKHINAMTSFLLLSWKCQPVQTGFELSEELEDDTAYDPVRALMLQSQIKIFSYSVGLISY